MWWNGQNIEKPVRANDGRLWHFRVRQDFVNGVYSQRIFFWDEDCREMGCVELPQALHISKIKQKLKKLVADASYRKQFRRELKFPVERYYS